MPAPAVTRTLLAEGAPRGGLQRCALPRPPAGASYYALPAAVRPISEDTGWDPALITGAFSAGLLLSAAAGVPVGRALDRVGPLTVLTLIAGFTSTIFAPLTAALSNGIGWRAAFLVLAGLLGVITVPLHARYLNRSWTSAQHGVNPAVVRHRVRDIRRSPEFIGLQGLMVLLCLGLYTVTLNIIPLLMEKGAGYATAAFGLGLIGAGQVGRRLIFSAIPSGARLPVITVTATVAILVLALLPGPAALLIAAGMLAGAVRGCQTLLQATVVADRWGTAGLGTLQGAFAAPLTAATALAPAAGPAMAAWLGSYTNMAYAMGAATGTAAAVTLAVRSTKATHRLRGVVEWAPGWQTAAMDIEQWWAQLKPSTRAWLIDNNGDAVPAEIVAEITDAGGSVEADAWWVGESGPSGFYFSDEAIDWIEAVGNGETPEPR